MEIRGREVLLTGASGGLGIAIADELSGRGAKLTLSARRVEELERLAERTRAEVLVADLTAPEGLERVLDIARRADVLVANAGMGSHETLAEVTAADVDRSIAVNLRAPILLATAFAQAHLERGRPGQIVFIGSLSGLAASPGNRMYNATKFGLRGFSLSLREDLFGTGIGVSIVEPGFIRDAGMFAASGMQLPKGVRTKRPSDVGAAVARAIESDPAELFVAPIELRLSVTLASVVPTLAAAIQRRVGAADIVATARPDS
jgi:short-subunit dehydrogenase